MAACSLRGSGGRGELTQSDSSVGGIVGGVLVCSVRRGTTEHHRVDSAAVQCLLSDGSPPTI